MNIPKNEEDKLAKIFSMLDKNTDGEISVEELEQVMRAMGKYHPKQEVKRVMTRVDKDGNGSVGYQEFLQMMWKHMNAKLSSIEIDEAFEAMDKDLNGGISREELLEAGVKAGVAITDDQVEAIFNETDGNGDGKIDYQEFRKIIKS